MTRLLEISAAEYTPHLLHLPDRPWTETNCWTDATIELLHALGLEPLAVAPFAVTTDFEGDQWEMYKFPPEDLRTVFGLEVHEMNPYRELDDQIVDLLRLGRLMTIEVDAWFLPDTHGISYRIEHKKTSIIVNEIDQESRFLGYFHNAGYFEARDEDYDGLLRVGRHAGTTEMLPYVELVNLDRMRRPAGQELTELAKDLLRTHLPRRPSSNPVRRMEARFAADRDWVRRVGERAFHTYAFVTARQTGAAADLVRCFCDWLADRDPDSEKQLRASASSWTGLSDDAKSLQLKLARIARGRDVDLGETFDSMSRHWREAQEHLDQLAP